MASRAAVALGRADFEVDVYAQAPALTEVGGGINMGPNAGRILYRLGLGAALDREAVRPASARQRRWQDGRTLQRAPLNPRCGELDVGAALPDGQTLVFFDAEGQAVASASVNDPSHFVPARVLSPGEELHRPAFTYFRGPVERLRRGDVHVLRRAGAGGAFLDDRIDAGDIVVGDVKPTAYTQ